MSLFGRDGVVNVGFFSSRYAPVDSFDQTSSNHLEDDETSSRIQNLLRSCSIALILNQRLLRPSFPRRRRTRRVKRRKIDPSSVTRICRQLVGNLVKMDSGGDVGVLEI